LSWIVEKRRSWSDLGDGGDIESVWERDHLLTSATIFWVTQTAGSSARFYKEQELNPWRPSRTGPPWVSAPTAVSVFVNDVYRMPKRWTERYFNLQQYRVHGHGGHFAPYEVPDIFVSDIRDFFRTFRSASI
jgi:hypothetical protein